VGAVGEKSPTATRSAPLPIYCSPASREKIGKIISITAGNDAVVNSIAELRQGIDEQTALSWTYDWRKQLDDPRLVDDGGPFREWLEDVLKLTLSGNLAIGPQLTFGDHNISVASMTSGLRSHSVIHSARIGSLLGWLLREEINAERLAYFETLAIPDDADDGEPMQPDSYLAWNRHHRTDMDFSGWVLKDITIAGTKRTKPRGDYDFTYWDFDHSWPDLFFCVRDAGGAGELFTSGTLLDRQSSRWQPSFHLRRDSRVHFIVKDRDLAVHDTMGSFLVESTGKERLPTSHRNDQFAVEMKWQPAHY